MSTKKEPTRKQLLIELAEAKKLIRKLRKQNRELKSSVGVLEDEVDSMRPHMYRSVV